MKKLARTSLCAGLGRAIKIAATSLRTKRSPAELLEQSEFQYQRRRFLKQAGSAALAASSLPILTNCAAKRLGSSGIEPRIVIVGAGLAGCTAAYYLTQAGFAPTIYEGSKRIGGRTFTLRNQFGPGLCTELGGEFIDSTHLDTLAFVKKFGFSLLDTRDPAEKHLHAQYYFDGQIYSDQDLVREITPVLKALARDVAVLAESQEAEAKFDRISISEYLRSRHVSGWLKKLLEVAYLTEYGLECDQQSSLNLLYLIATEINDSKFELFGESDERYKISGGNDQLAQALFEASGATAISDHRLEAVE